MIELKPCPICGGKVNFDVFENRNADDSYDYFLVVDCPECGCVYYGTGKHEDMRFSEYEKKELSYEWNGRANNG